MLKALCAIPVVALTINAFATPIEIDPVEDMVKTLETKNVPNLDEVKETVLNTTAEAVEATSEDKPFAIHPVADQYGRILYFTHEGEPANGYFDYTAEYVFIDGRQATEAELKNYKTLLANSKFEMLKNANGTAKYDYKDKHGIIVIHTQDASTAPDDGEPLIVVNGHIVKVDVSQLGKDINLMKDENLHKILGIEEDDIESVTVLKDGAATAIYGDQGKNGVIEIKTKKRQAEATNNDDPIFEVCEEIASYPGGQGAMMQFLAQNVRYPKEAAEHGAQGRVLVQFVVEKDGSRSNYTIVKKAENIITPNAQGGITVNAQGKPAEESTIPQEAFEALNEEAVKVIKSMPNWIPAKQRGQVVRMRYTLPIVFRLQ
jgi:TonB-dependent SusC/RagA subfamily outer membrane receptor